MAVRIVDRAHYSVAEAVGNDNPPIATENAIFIQRMALPMRIKFLFFRLSVTENIKEGRKSGVRTLL